MSYNNVTARISANLLSGELNPGTLFGSFSVPQTTKIPQFPQIELLFGTGAGKIDLMSKFYSDTLAQDTAVQWDLKNLLDPYNSTIVMARIKAILLWNFATNDAYYLIAGASNVQPGAAPTVSVGGSGGTFAPGAYLASYSQRNASGASLRSPDSTPFTISGAQIPTITLGALIGGVVSRDVYISTVGGDRTTETLSGSAITASTYAPTTNIVGAAPPTEGTDYYHGFTAPFNGKADGSIIVPAGFVSGANTFPNPCMLFAPNATAYTVGATTNLFQLVAVGGPIQYGAIFLGCSA